MGKVFAGTTAMTREDIIDMAAQAGIDESVWFYNPEALERFAALIAEAEREACAEVCERLPETFKIAADEFGYTAEQPTAENYAAAILARA
jgi:D-aminopeptidase